MNMNPMRTGSFAAAGSAQPMLSRSGSARLRPRPFRTVRRSIRQRWSMGSPSYLPRDLAIQERIAGRDLDPDRLEFVAVLGDVVRDLVGDDLVIPAQAAAQRVRQRPAHEVAAELVLSRDDDRLQVRGPVEGDVAGELALCIDQRAGVVLVAPAPDDVEVFEAEADGVDRLVTAEAGGVRAMLLHSLPEVEGGVGGDVLLLERRNVGGRAGGRLTEHLLENPAAALHGAGPIRQRRHGEHARQREDAAAVLVAERDADQL